MRYTNKNAFVLLLEIGKRVRNCCFEGKSLIIFGLIFGNLSESTQFLFFKKPLQKDFGVHRIVVENSWIGILTSYIILEIPRALNFPAQSVEKQA